MINKIIEGDCLKSLREMPDKSVNCCITSPPYYGLRDYGNEGQIGLEETPEQFVEQLVQVFREVKRILKDDGTLWLNLGDSYWGGKGKSGSRDGEYQEERAINGKSLNKKHQQMGGKGETRPTDKKHDVIKPKDLIGIPWMVAFALRSDGWYLRQDIIWHKPNPMPESVTDRCTKAHEYIFLLSKSKQYYFDNDAIRGPIKLTEGDTVRFRERKTSSPFGNRDEDTQQREVKYDEIKGANKRSVWAVNTKPYSGAHFATFPEELITDCIKAGCPENGIVLDPFGGAGTTAVVARKLNRNYLLCELNPDYIKIAENRLKQELGLFI